MCEAYGHRMCIQTTPCTSSQNTQKGISVYKYLHIVYVSQFPHTLCMNKDCVCDKCKTMLKEGHDSMCSEEMIAVVMALYTHPGKHYSPAIYAVKKFPLCTPLTLNHSPTHLPKYTSSPPLMTVHRQTHTHSLGGMHTVKWE